jgi:hypothetical protein
MSGTDKVKIYYWDACAYLTWINGDAQEHGPEYLAALNQTAKENFEKKNIIITSAIIFTEVLSSRFNQDQQCIFRKSFRSGDHIAYDVDPPIALKAGEFREALVTHESGRKLATPDAIHLATASIYKADEFWTFDNGKKDKRHLGLLDLSKDERIGGLVICKPNVQQAQLPLSN